MTSVSGLDVRSKDAPFITLLRVVLYLVSVCIQSYGVCQILRRCVSSTTAQEHIPGEAAPDWSWSYDHDTGTSTISYRGRDMWVTTYE